MVEEQGGDIGPTLAPLARKYLAVQATSASSEGLFSTVGNTVIVKRARLSDDNVENIVFLHTVTRGYGNRS